MIGWLSAGRRKETESMDYPRKRLVWAVYKEVLPKTLLGGWWVTSFYAGGLFCITAGISWRFCALILAALWLAKLGFPLFLALWWTRRPSSRPVAPCSSCGRIHRLFRPKWRHQ